MGLFRRSRPLHERLAEDADLDIGGEPRQPNAFAGFLHDLAARDVVGIHGVARPRTWDTVASVEAELPGDEVRFVALPDGTLLVDEDVPEEALPPLAEAVEAAVPPPYRAEGVRRGASLWVVGARRIEVAAYPERLVDEFELVEDDRVVIGRRLDGDLFEIEVSPL